MSNAEVLKRGNIAPVDVFIRAARLRWLGHVVRMPEERIPNYLLHWVPKHGKRSRGSKWSAVHVPCLSSV